MNLRENGIVTLSTPSDMDFLEGRRNLPHVALLIKNPGVLRSENLRRLLKFCKGVKFRIIWIFGLEMSARALTVLNSLVKENQVYYTNYKTDAMNSLLSTAALAHNLRLTACHLSGTQLLKLMSSNCPKLWLLDPRISPGINRLTKLLQVLPIRNLVSFSFFGGDLTAKIVNPWLEQAFLLLEQLVVNPDHQSKDIGFRVPLTRPIWKLMLNVDQQGKNLDADNVMDRRMSATELDNSPVLMVIREEGKIAVSHTGYWNVQ